MEEVRALMIGSLSVGAITIALLLTAYWLIERAIVEVFG